MTDPSPVQTVVIVGAGTMGRGIAQVSASSGFDVWLVDSTKAALTQARTTIEVSLAKLVDKGTLSAADRDRAIVRLRFVDSLDVAASADLVVEAVVENEGAKCMLFAQLDRLAPARAILASNTSSIPIARLALATGRPDRVAGMHFMNPVPLMPLVEIIRGHDTSPKTLETIHAVTARLGKVGVHAADAPGFIANRILMPMINEAVHALREGVGTAEAIDQVMKLGMRHPMGPLALADLIGLDVCVAILDVLRSGFKDQKYKRRAHSSGRWSRPATWDARPAGDSTITRSPGRVSVRRAAEKRPSTPHTATGGEPAAINRAVGPREPCSGPPMSRTGARRRARLER